MLDIRLLRDQPEEVKARVKTRGGDYPGLVDEVLAFDQTRRKACLLYTSPSPRD